MALFVATYLGDRYVTHRSNRVDQAIYALVRRKLADVVQPWLPKGSTVEKLWRNSPYYPWAPSRRLNGNNRAWRAIRSC